MELDNLIKARAVVLNKLNNFSNYIERFEASGGEFDTLLFRYERAFMLINEYEQVQLQIDLNSTIDSEIEASFRADFENSYYKCMTRAKHLINGPKMEVSNPTPEIANVKLPTIELPKFDGSYDKWLEFRDTFEHLVHNNNTITNIQKFYYLRSALLGQAAQVIESLAASNSNYELAWTLICDRFNNSKILKNNHVKALFNIEKAQGESADALRALADNLTKHIRSLAALGEPTEHWDTLLIYLASTKLSDVSLREWEKQKSELTDIKFDSFSLFLTTRADYLESIEAQKRPKTNNTNNRVKTFTVNKSSNQHNRLTCVMCNGPHFIYSCARFQNASTKERSRMAKEAKLCLNCLRRGHFVGECRATSCSKCGQRHNTMLHFEESKSDSVTLTLTHDQPVLLATVSVRVFDRQNKPQLVRALLDPGSQSSFITTSLANNLGLPQENISMQVTGFSESRSKIKNSMSIKIQSRINNFSFTSNCLIIDRITTDLPSTIVTNIRIPPNIVLADPNFNVPGKVDMLLGADHFWSLLTTGQRTLGAHGPILQSTHFGYIVSGPISHSPIKNTICNLALKSNVELEKQLCKFWKLEAVPKEKPLSIAEKECESTFKETTSREIDGKFIVKLPLSQNADSLGQSIEIAKRRFLNLENRLQSSPNLKNQYIKFMREYISLGHMTEVPFQSDKTNYYMPHHGVFKQSSSTTKLRVVFDASCATSNGVSLNDIQYTGPVLQPDLFTTLVRFRKYNYVFVADIEKMYRMCWMNREHTPLQRVLWREEPSDPLKAYELLTVTYGTTAASYLAIRCLKQVGLECSDPKISNIIRNHFYVDDLLTGCDSIDELAEIAKQLTKTLSAAGFKLHKWLANNQDITKFLSQFEANQILDFAANENTKTLGLLWNSHQDVFKYSIGKDSNSQTTKRTILSEITQIFDPLGLLSPIIISAKIIIQKLWMEGIGWDEPLPVYLLENWVQLRTELDLLKEIKIPRQVTCPQPISVELHGFSDSSSFAYGACIYLRSFDRNGNIHVNLIAAKSRVAPVKGITIPRLELTAALLLSELMDKVKNALDLTYAKIVYWTDSSIVLSWLKIPVQNLQIFVANRVSNILELTLPHEWRHVPSQDNPADCVSRGITPEHLINFDIYWHGPHWLNSHNDHNFPSKIASNENVPELRQKTNCQVVTQIDNEIFTRFSSLNRLKRVLTYCVRFKNNCLKPKILRETGPLTSSEINQTFLRLLSVVQEDSFHTEIDELKRGNLLEHKNRLMNLNPFIAADGLLRVGGRLVNSEFNFDKKHPIILHSRHHLVHLLFKNEHEKLLHAGPNHVLASLREQFWPVQGRNLARKIVHNCIRCFRAKPQFNNPLMGNLPGERVKHAPPFYTTGVDYAGPFFIKNKPGRGATKTKCYVGVYVCFATKAIHLELISDLTKEAFIAALRHFIARRGKPHKIWSDNGTNFVGANRELQELGKFLSKQADALTSQIENFNICWCFIPPQSPHFGGWWEAGVKSMKHHLKRVANNVCFTFEQFYTLLTQIEAVLNSRRLTPLSSSPLDLTPLTPSHFLIGRPATDAADPNLNHLAANKLSLHQHIQQLKQHFWARWSLECVSEMQQRTKWRDNYGSLKVDDLVIIKEDNLPPLRWSLGRIESLYPGKDGISRVASVRTSTGVVRRSFAKLCPLPMC